nr:MAG: hypothetical protein [Bacteriophage sp.]UWG87594.1 MAG: hypothetical protein [Bacteriophage sp.]
MMHGTSYFGRAFLFLGINSVEEDTAYIRVVEGSIPSFPIASYGENSNSIVPD